MATMEYKSIKLYALGSNGCGQLGVGHREDLNSPQICKFSILESDKDTSNQAETEHLPIGESVKRLVAGGNHTLILTTKGRLLAAGNTDCGRCGIPVETPSLMIFTQANSANRRNITHIAATFEASFFVEDARIVWACGSGGKGELGLGEDCPQAVQPMKVFDAALVDEDCHVEGISASMGHVVIILSNGKAYGWGSCRQGQLGQQLQPQKVMWTPQLLDLSLLASNVVTGRDFSLFQSIIGDFVLLGGHSLGGPLKHLDIAPKKSQLASGWSTVYLHSEGRVAAIGQGRRGQLPPRDLPEVTALAAGSEHCVAAIDENEAIAWGWGEHGNCGEPVDERKNIVNRFNHIRLPSSDGSRVDGVGAGCATTFIWTCQDA